MAEVAPLVCVPGTLCDARLFDPMLAALGCAAQVFELADDSVGAAAGRMLAAAPPRFVAVGFSLGGFVVLEVLRRAPGRLAGAVLIASHAHPDSPAAAAERTRQAVLFDQGGPAALIADRWPRYVAAGALDRSRLRGAIMAMAAGFDSAAFARQSALAASRPDARAAGNPARVPLLVLGGDADALCPPERARAAALALDGTYVALPGVGHFAPLEAPAQVAAELAAWLATLREAASCS